MLPSTAQRFPDLDSKALGHSGRAANRHRHRGYASAAHRQGCVGVLISEQPYRNPSEVLVSTSVKCTPVLALGIKGEM